MHVKELLVCLGSPFQYTVGQLQTGGSYKVQVGGPGLERGEVNMESRLKLLKKNIHYLCFAFFQIHVFCTTTFVNVMIIS